jgi:two-component system nitrate/nitrite response regulator NarL
MAATDAIRVLVAEGSPFTRAGVRPALEAEGCVVCAEAGDAESAVEAALRERPDVCLLDTGLRGDALEAAAAIADNLPGTAVIMFASSPSEDGLFSALRAGASGYLSKEIEPSQLAVAFRGVRKGEAALPRTLVAKLIKEFRRCERRRPLPLRQLTSREIEVLELLSQGLTTAEIADRLFVAPVTVRTHIASILRKLGVPDRQSAIRLLNSR